MAIFDFGLNFILCALLGTTIAYCWVLNKRIKVLQDSRSELASLMQHFDESTNQAAESILGLQSASKRIGETISDRMAKAQHTITDLEFVTERAEKLADKLEAALAIQRQQTKLSMEPAATEAAPSKTPAAPVAFAEAVKPLAVKQEPIALKKEPTATKSRAISNLEAMLTKLSTRTSSDPVLRGANRPVERAAGAKGGSAEEKWLEMFDTKV